MQRDTLRTVSADIKARPHATWLAALLAAFLVFSFLLGFLSAVWGKPSTDRRGDECMVEGNCGAADLPGP